MVMAAVSQAIGRLQELHLEPQKSSILALGFRDKNFLIPFFGTTKQEGRDISNPRGPRSDATDHMTLRIFVHQIASVGVFKVNEVHETVNEFLQSSR